MRWRLIATRPTVAIAAAAILSAIFKLFGVYFHNMLGDLPLGRSQEGKPDKNLSTPKVLVQMFKKTLPRTSTFMEILS